MEPELRVEDEEGPDIREGGGRARADREPQDPGRERPQEKMQTVPVVTVSKPFPRCGRFPPQYPRFWAQLRVYQASSNSCILGAIVAASIKSITFLIVPESLKVRMTIAHKCQGTMLSPPYCRASRQGLGLPASQPAPQFTFTQAPGEDEVDGRVRMCPEWGLNLLSKPPAVFAGRTRLSVQLPPCVCSVGGAGALRSLPGCLS